MHQVPYLRCWLIRLLALALAYVTWVTHGHAQVVINEVMASNQQAVEHFGQYSDWIELYNPTDVETNLGSWYIRSIEDNGFSSRDTNVFRFPAFAPMGPHQRLVVWCDNNTNSPGYHTRFVLDRTGCALTLLLPNGAVQTNSGVSFGLQLTDRSIGRVPDGGTNWTLNTPSPGGTNLAVALGPVTALRINEWAPSNTLAKCASGEAEPDGASEPVCPDWIEIYNLSPLPVPLSGLTISDRPSSAPDFRFLDAITNLSFIEAHGFQRFRCDNERKPADHLEFRLSSTGGETLQIYDVDRVTVIEEVSFPGNMQIPGYWPGDTSRGRFPDGGPIDDRLATEPTPGEPNFYVMTNVAINEVLANTSPPLEDAIELRNTTAALVDISGWWISDEKFVPKKFRVPPGVSLAPFGFQAFYEMRGMSNSMPRPGFNTHDGALPEDFGLSSLGDDVWVFSASNDPSGTLTGFRAGMRFGVAESGVSFGSIMNSVGEAVVAPLVSRTFGVNNPISVEQFRQGAGAPNAGPRLSPLVISEIYYHPPDIIRAGAVIDNNIHEFVEIYNRSTSPVLLYDPVNYGFADGRTNTWRLGGHVQVHFPTNEVIAPGEFVVAVNFALSNTIALNHTRDRFNIPSHVRLIGPYSRDPGLNNDGGTIALERPDAPKPPGHADAGVVPYVSWDRVDYHDDSGWSVLPDGATNIVDPSGIHVGYSLQRIVVEDYGNDPINWIAANPTPGRQPSRVELIASQGTNIFLRFRGWAGASYTIEHASSPSAESWTVLTNFPPAASSGLRQVLELARPATGMRVYRVRSP